MRDYTIEEVEALRDCAISKIRYDEYGKKGDFVFDGNGRPVPPSDEQRILAEEMTRTHMLAGLTAGDLLALK
jgi:hypothetical protein